MRPRRSFGSKQPSVASSVAQMKTMLATTRDPAALTVDQLVRMYRVDRKTAEYELMIAQQRRAG